MLKCPVEAVLYVTQVFKGFGSKKGIRCKLDRDFYNTDKRNRAAVYIWVFLNPRKIAQSSFKDTRQHKF